MHNPTTDERLHALETQMRSTKRRCRQLVFGMATLLFMAAFSCSTAKPRELHVAKIAIEDGFGRVRAELGVDDQGGLGPLLTMTDENGTLRVVVTAAKDGPALALTDANGQRRIALSAPANGPGFLMQDELGRTRVGLGMTKGGPALRLSDESGTARAEVGLNKDRPGVFLIRNGQPGITMEADDDESLLNLFDKQGKARAQLGADDHGGLLNLVDGQGHPQAQLGGTNGSGTLVLSDPTGKRRSIAP